MGEHADDAMDAAWDSHFENIDPWDDNEDIDLDTPRIKKIPKCNRCGKTPLVWKQLHGRWYLHEIDGKFHSC